MDAWDLLILTCAAGFAVAALVRMMLERQNELIRQRAREIDLMSDDPISTTLDEKNAA